MRVSDNKYEHDIRKHLRLNTELTSSHWDESKRRWISTLKTADGEETFESSAFVSAIAVNRGALPDGRAIQTQMVAENNRVASRSVWDGTVAGSGVAADFTTLDFFRIEDGLVAEHWESVDWVRAYQAFGLLSDEVNDE